MSLNLNDLIRAVKSTDTILTARVKQWLITDGDRAYPEEVMKTIYDLLTTEPRVRVGTFSASSAGLCPRRQVLSFLGQPDDVTDPQLQNIFNDGKWRHLRWQAMLLTMGALNEIEYSLKWRKHKAVGTMDGLGVVPMDHPRSSWRGREFGFELKGISTFQFGGVKNDGPLEKHLDQVHRYFLMSGLDLFVMIYEDKSTQEFVEKVIEPDPKRLEAQRKEVECLDRSVSRRELPVMLPGCQKQQGTEWNQCPFGGRNGPCARAGVWPKPDRKNQPRGSITRTP